MNFFWYFSLEKNISQLYCHPPALVLICLLLPFSLLNLYKLGEKSINVRCKKNHCMQLLNDVTEIFYKSQTDWAEDCKIIPCSKQIEMSSCPLSHLSILSKSMSSICFDPLSMMSIVSNSWFEIGNDWPREIWNTKFELSCPL